MRKEKKERGGYVSKHAAPAKKSRKDRYEETEYEENVKSTQYESEDEPEYSEELEPETQYDEGEEPDAPDEAADEDNEADDIEYADEDYPEDDKNGKASKKGKKKDKKKKKQGKADLSDADKNLSPEQLERLEKRRKRRRKFKITMIVLLVLVILLGGAATVGGFMVTHGNTSFPNVYIDGVAVGKMSEDAVKTAIEDSGWDDKASTPLTVNLMDSVSFEIGLYESGARLTVDKATDAVMSYGHSGNWYVNLWNYIKGLLLPVDINKDSIEYDTDYIRSQCEAGIKKLEEELGDGSYEIDKEKSVLRMVKGAGELEFDLDAMTDAVVSALENGSKKMSYSDITEEPAAPDFDAIYKELSAEPADAHYKGDGSFEVVDDVEGCDFDVSEAKSIWNAAKPAETVEIPVKLTYPEVTGDYLRGLLYRDKLGEMTTYFPNSSDDRISNIQLACSKIDGLILYPGDVFSYNDTLGQRTEAAGFKMAGAYSNGEVVEEIGGGICQVSSTLYTAVLYSYEVTTVERSPHYFPVDYLEKGYDATVSWPSPDFKFRNDRDFPIKIVATCNAEERYVTVAIMGTNLDGTYIELKKETYSYNNTKYPDIMEGYGVQVHRIVYDANGMQIDQIDEVYDVYHTHEATEEIKARDAAAAAAGTDTTGLAVTG